MTALMYQLHDYRSEFLSQEKPGHKENIGIPDESDATQKPEGYNKGNRNMDGQEPLGGEALHICPPITKGDIQKENYYTDENKQAHSDLSKI